jgi:hypothetical protein
MIIIGAEKGKLAKNGHYSQFIVGRSRGEKKERPLVAVCQH